MRFPSVTSPMAFMFPRGSHRRCSASTTGIWERTGTSAAAKPRIWEGIENVDDGELWETHLSLKSQLLEFVRRRAVEQAERRGETTRGFATTRQGTQSGRAHYRICPPLCDLQAS